MAMNIHSPMASGNGAYIMHRVLESAIPGYQVCGYDPRWTFFPPALYALCRGRHPDIIHSTPDYAVFSARRRTPLVITFHGYTLDRALQQYNSPLQNLHYSTDLKWFTHRAMHKASCITAVSRFTAELVRSDTGLQQEIRVIYNGIDENRFVPATSGPDRTRGINVLFSGNLTRKKGADLLPEIATMLNPGISILYTSGLRSNSQLPAHPALRCVGQVPHEEMPKLYNNCDILLFPTVREGFGLAAAEAMACGLPVVTSNCSSLPELVEHEKGGYLCPPGDAAALADCINTLADSASLRREMGDYNRVRVEQDFTLARMVSEYRALFSEILDKR
jgi:glycosyltransferase involved in cell wall biosynthesis